MGSAAFGLSPRHECKDTPPQCSGPVGRAVAGFDMADVPDITPEQIRERAHELWERNHRPDGFDLEFWLLAERELRAERALQAARSRDEAAASQSRCGEMR